MNYTLIKLQDKYILCSNKKIKEGDWFYVKTQNIEGGNIVNQSTGNGKFAWKNHILSKETDERGYHPNHCLKIIAGIEGLPNIDFSLLSEKDCKEIGYIKDKELEKEIKYWYEKTGSLTSEEIVRRAYSLGLTINNKQYTLEDIEEIVKLTLEDAKKSVLWSDEYYINLTKEIITKISQPKQWNVEIEVEDKITLDGHTKIGKEPKIENNTIKITKICQILDSQRSN